MTLAARQTARIALPTGVFPTGGKGRKPCPFDPSHFLAARITDRCPACNKDLPQKPKKAAPALTEKAIAAVEDLGGIQAVKKEIEAARKALDVLKPLGGLETAEKTVDLMERLKKL